MEKTWKIKEQEIREEIAQKIEEQMMAEGLAFADDHELMGQRELAVWKYCLGIIKGRA